MPKKTTPGVYIEEVVSANKSIARASTSIAGMVGMTVRGPVNQPTLMTNQAEFAQLFGGFLEPQRYDRERDALPYAVEGFFANGGMHLYVVRVLGKGAAEAAFDVVMQGDLPDIFSRQNAVERPPVLRVHARYPGDWGNSLKVALTFEYSVSTQVAATAGASETAVTLASAADLLPGILIKIEDPLKQNKGILREVAAIDPAQNKVWFTQSHGQTLTLGMTVVRHAFTLSVEHIESGTTIRSEIFENLSLNKQHPRYAPSIVGCWNAVSEEPSFAGQSDLIRLEHLSDEEKPFFPMSTECGGFLSGGNDDLTGVTDEVYCGNASAEPAQRTGIFALENEPTVSLVASPGQASIRVQKALIAHCEYMRYRFAVLDTPIGASVTAALAHRQHFDSTHCAIYYPSLVRVDSFDAMNGQRVISPAGHILGIYARTDTTRGVHKAPANEELRGILAFDSTLDNSAQNTLNPHDINCLRDFRAQNRGLRVFGARVATSDPEFKYINVRRLILMIEQSLDIGLRWVVFEPNGQLLWGTVKRLVTDYLTGIWRSGALAGQKVEEAFFVSIGYNQTMTQDDIAHGRLIVEIGIAPIKPAEFVVLRVNKKTHEA